MRKSKLNARTTAKSRAKNNYLDFGTNVFENKTLHDFIKAKNSLKDLDIFNNQYLQLIVAKTIYK